MAWWSSLWTRPPSTAQHARRRLHDVLRHARKERPAHSEHPEHPERQARQERQERQDRAARQPGKPRAPEYLPALQRELQLVVAKYIDVLPRDVAVRFAQPRHAPAGLEVRIELPQDAPA